jgi:hypothetical protein
VRLTQALAGQGVSPLPRPVAASLGRIPWPPPGSSRDRPRAGFMTAPGQFLLAIDTSVGGWGSFATAAALRTA